MSGETIIRAAPGGLQDGSWPPAHGFRDIQAYWRDPAPFEAERPAGQAAIDALFAEHDARVRAEQEARWAREDRP